MGKHINRLDIGEIDAALERNKKLALTGFVSSFKPASGESSCFFLDGGVLKFYNASTDTTYVVGMTEV
jgi:hypothetical protein